MAKEFPELPFYLDETRFLQSLKKELPDKPHVSGLPGKD